MCALSVGGSGSAWGKQISVDAKNCTDVQQLVPGAPQARKHPSDASNTNGHSLQHEDLCGRMQ